jgi:hypothetical protein
MILRNVTPLTLAAATNNASGFESLDETLPFSFFDLLPQAPFRSLQAKDRMSLTSPPAMIPVLKEEGTKASDDGGNKDYHRCSKYI